MAYRDKLLKLGDSVEKQVVDVYRLFAQGKLDRAETIARMAALIAKGNASAVALADVSLAAQLMLELGEAIPTEGLVRPAGDLERLHKASRTTLEVAEVSPVPESIVGRLVRGEVFESGARAYSDGIKKSKAVKGWVRVMSPGACELCQWWSREGREWPAIHPMQTHKGCTCSQQVVVSTDIQETGFSKKVAAAEAHAEARKAKRSK